MRHDEIAADLARKLEKATPGPFTTDWPNDTRHHLCGVRAYTECGCLGYFRSGDDEDAVTAAVNAAQLLLSERAALRKLEDAARKALEPSGLMETSLSSRNERIECVKAALRALDRLREEA